MEHATPPAPPQHRVRNRLLRALPAQEYARVGPRLEPVRYDTRDVLIDYDAPITHVHFVETGVISLVAAMADGVAIETATTGPEGFVGVPVTLGADRQAAQAFCQVPGAGLRMDAAAFRTLLPDLPALRGLLGLYTQALLTLVMQTSGCNSVHLLRERCARWMLMTHDRVGADTFPLTHHFLSQMLGVRRASVTEAAGVLQNAGAIRYSHGSVAVVDRAKLEAQACECYAIIAREFARLLDGVQLATPLHALPTSRDGRSVLADGTPRGQGVPVGPEA
jgi:CRP-like cAMP-binding protein